jgi:hypothetical protein
MKLHFFEEAAREIEHHRACYREQSETAEVAFLDVINVVALAHSSGVPGTGKPG